MPFTLLYSMTLSNPSPGYEYGTNSKESKLSAHVTTAQNTEYSPLPTRASSTGLARTFSTSVQIT